MKFRMKIIDVRSNEIRRNIIHPHSLYPWTNSLAGCAREGTGLSCGLSLGLVSETFSVAGFIRWSSKPWEYQFVYSLPLVARSSSATMVATATMVGAIMGLSCQFYSNGVRKLPLMRRESWTLSLSADSILLRRIKKAWFRWNWCGFRWSTRTDPWEHVLAIGLGAGFGNAVANWEVRLQEDLDKKLSEVQTANNKRYIGKRFVCQLCGVLLC